MKVLVTGITGFVGSHLLKDLIAEGHDITGIIRRDSNLERIIAFQDQVRLTSWSTEEFRNEFFDLVIHLATDYGRGSSLGKLLTSNLAWPLEILETLSETNPNLVFINTDSFFNKGDLSYDYLGDYTLSKRILVMALKSYSNKRSIINMQLEHVYGPEDGLKKFVPRIISRMFNNESQIDLTTGTQRRDFIYIKDVVRAYLTVINQINSFDIGFHQIEVGTGQSNSIRQIVELINKEISVSETCLNWGALPQRVGEFEESKANTSTLNNMGWKPEISLQQGIKETVTSYNRNKA